MQIKFKSCSKIYKVKVRLSRSVTKSLGNLEGQKVLSRTKLSSCNNSFHPSKGRLKLAQESLAAPSQMGESFNILQKELRLYN